MSLIPRFFTHLAAGVALMLAGALGAQQPTSNPSRSSGQSTNDPIARIRDEGLNRSQAMDLLTHLTDVIGPRLTGSPNLKRANEWTRDKLASWGLTNAHLHGWPFGRGWSLRRFSAQVVEPQNIPLVAWPQAWSCGSDWPVVADVVHLNAKTETELDQFKGRLKGAVVLVSSPRAVPQRYEPLASRLTDSDLLRLANATPGRRDTYTWMNRPTNAPPSANVPARSPRTDRSEASSQPPRTNEVRAAAATNQPSARPPRQIGTYERIPFAIREGAAVIVLCSAKGDAGTLMAQWAMVFPPASSPMTPRSSASRAASAPPPFSSTSEEEDPPSELSSSSPSEDASSSESNSEEEAGAAPLSPPPLAAALTTTASARATILWKMASLRRRYSGWAARRADATEAGPAAMVAGEDWSGR